MRRWRSAYEGWAGEQLKIVGLSALSGVCSKEADGDELGAGRTGSRFSAFSWNNTGTEKMEVQLQNR